MTNNAGQEHGIDDTIRGRPSAISRQDSHTSQHESEPVVDRAKTSNQTERVAVANEEREGIAR
jgi:hypothetical protein